MKNADNNTKTVKDRCESKLDIRFKTSKECNGWFLLDGKKERRITVPKGRKEIPPKTYQSMAKGLGLSTDQFDRLLACPLTREDYEEIVRGPN